MSGPNDPVLWDENNKPLSVAGAMIAPNALNVAQLFQQAGRMYLSRQCEAMRDAPLNALAMGRDTFYLSLIQERTAPTINLDWEVKVQDEDNPIQKLDGEIMQRAWDELPNKTHFMTWILHHGVFVGRAAQQGVWGKSDSGLTNWIYHEPVHGDSVQFQLDGTPVILVNNYTAERIRSFDPAAIISATDRGSYGLRLYKPQYRRRFCIYKHNCLAADYFEGEMSGGVHGVGLRSWLYWGDFIRRDTLAAMLGFVNSVGLMDIVVFNYPTGNVDAENRAKANAKQISDKIAFICPRDPSKNDWKAIEQYPFNTAGVEVLKSLIVDMYDRYAILLITGQEMSTGGGSSGLEGDGKADFARDTKFQLTKMDAKKAGEMLTRDWLLPCRDYNRPGSTTPMSLVPVLEDPREKVKAQNITVCIQSGIEIEEDEARRALGFKKPRPGKNTIGKPPEQPTGEMVDPNNPDNPPSPASGRATNSDNVADLFGNLGELLFYRAAEPPWPGAVFNEFSHRWENPGSGRDEAKVTAGVHQAIIKSWHTVKSQLTSDERERVEQYTESPANFNRPLLSGSPLNETQKRRMATLDSAIAKAPPFAESVTLHRGFRVKEGDAQTGEFMAKLRAASESGEPLHIPSYLSGSADPAVGERFRGSGKVPGETPIAMEVVATRGLFTDPISSSDNPLKEVVLPRGGQYRVSVRNEGGTTIYRLEQLKTPEIPTNYSTDAQGNEHSAADGKFVSKGNSGGSVNHDDFDASYPMRDSVDHENDVEFVKDMADNPDGLGDDYRANVSQALKDKDEYATAVAGTIKNKDSKELFAKEYSSRRQNAEQFGFSYASAMKTAAESQASLDAIRSEIEFALQFDPDYPEPPPKPKDPAKAAEVLAEYKAVRKAEFERAKNEAKKEAAPLIAKSQEIKEELKTRLKSVKQLGKKYAAAMDEMAEYIRGFGSDQTNYEAQHAPSGGEAKAKPRLSCVLLNLEGEARMRLLSLAATVADEDLAEKGREEETHVTVRYGLHTEVPEPVERLLRGIGPIQLHLGKVSVFDGRESGKPYDVLKVSVTSPDLKQLNWRLGALPNTQTFDYNPHATIAYVKAGLGSQYAKKMGELNIDVSVTWVMFSAPDKKKTPISLTEEPILYEAQHAPKGGVTVQGTFYPGGKFIPVDVVERATDAEKKAIKGGGESGDRPKPEKSGRATTRKAKPKSVGRAIGHYDVARSRQIKRAHKVEKEVSQAIEGYNLADSEPADIMHIPEVDSAGNRTGKGAKFADQREARAYLAKRARWVEVMKDEGQSPEERERARQFLEERSPLTFLEVKTLLKAKQNRVRITASALEKKEKWQDKYHARFLMVIVDDRKGEKHSGHRVYTQPEDEGLSKTHALEHSRKVDKMENILAKSK